MLIKELFESYSNDNVITDAVKRNLETALIDCLTDDDRRLLKKLEAVDWVATTDCPHFEIDDITYSKEYKSIDIVCTASSSGLHGYDKDDTISPYSNAPITKLNTHNRRSNEILPKLVKYYLSIDVDSLVFDKTGKYPDAQDVVFDETGEYSMSVFKQFKEFLIADMEVNHASADEYFGDDNDY